jgi:elongation factor Ts
MAISAAQIKELREATGAGVLDCKRALEANAGDFERAKAWLNEKGLAAAAKKADRAAKEGRVEVYVHPGNRVAVMVEVNCETDFVANTEAFQSFAHEVALHIAFANPQYVDKADLPAALVQAEEARLRERALADGKPEKVLDRIVSGQMVAFYQEKCLLQQPFVKDDEQTVGDLLKQTISTIGENVIVRRFARFELGASPEAE